MNVHNAILKKLSEAESHYQMKIPIAIESGSRAWGFSSPDSDYDCRFIYVRPKEDYLTVFVRKDTITYTPDAIFDLDGWDVKKVIQHIVKSNAVMFEWLSSSIIYRQNREIWQLLWDLSQRCFNPISIGYHYLNMAKGKCLDLLATDSFKLKGYFYILRPLIAVEYMMKTGRIPYMEFQNNLREIDIASPVRNAIECLLEVKEAASEGDSAPPHPILVPFFQQEIEKIELWLQSQIYEKPLANQNANETFRSVIELTWKNE